MLKSNNIVIEFNTILTYHTTGGPNMFRKMRRYKQELELPECIDILKKEVRGVLSVIGDDGYPYGVPIDYWYDESNGCIYFHGAKEGHKIDAIKACDKVSFCVYDEGYRNEGEWALNIRSVIVFGRIKPVTDDAVTINACTNLCHKFTDSKEYIDRELTHSAPSVLCLCLTPEHITGKMVNES